MLLDIVQTILGELPEEFEFIYYIVLLLFSLGVISIIFTPFYALFRSFFKRS